MNTHAIRYINFATGFILRGQSPIPRRWLDTEFNGLIGSLKNNLPKDLTKHLDDSLVKDTYIESITTPATVVARLNGLSTDVDKSIFDAINECARSAPISKEFEIYWQKHREICNE